MDGPLRNHIHPAGRVLTSAKLLIDLNAFQFIDMVELNSKFFPQKLREKERNCTARGSGVHPWYLLDLPMFSVMSVCYSVHRGWGTCAYYP